MCALLFINSIYFRLNCNYSFQECVCLILWMYWEWMREWGKEIEREMMMMTKWNDVFSLLLIHDVIFRNTCENICCSIEAHMQHYYNAWHKAFNNNRNGTKKRRDTSFIILDYIILHHFICSRSSLMLVYLLLMNPYDWLTWPNFILKLRCYSAIMSIQCYVNVPWNVLFTLFSLHFGNQ